MLKDKNTQNTIADIKKYIELYNTEDYLFKKIGPAGKKRGYFTFEEFYKICMWKTRRQKNRYLKNTNRIEDITRNSFGEKDEQKKMEKLCELDGVSVPVASAILTIYDPASYGIIDIRCIEMLNILGYQIPKIPSVKTWLKFISVIREIAKSNAITPREVDMALFAMHQEYLDQNNYRPLYKKY